MLDFQSLYYLTWFVHLRAHNHINKIAIGNCEAWNYGFIWIGHLPIFISISTSKWAKMCLARYPFWTVFHLISELSNLGLHFDAQMRAFVLTSPRDVLALIFLLVPPITLPKCSVNPSVAITQAYCCAPLLCVDPNLSLPSVFPSVRFMLV